jgi:hypothetical protein
MQVVAHIMVVGRGKYISIVGEDDPSPPLQFTVQSWSTGLNEFVGFPPTDLDTKDLR